MHGSRKSSYGWYRFPLFLALVIGCLASVSSNSVCASSITPITIIGGTSEQFPLMGVHTGDTVSIQVTMSTSDPGENGEGESLVLTYDTPAEVNLSTHTFSKFDGQPYTWSFVAQENAPSLNVNFTNADSDETANIQFSVNQKQFTSSKQKTTAQNGAQIFSKTGLYFTVAGIIAPGIYAKALSLVGVGILY